MKRTEKSHIKEMKLLHGFNETSIKFETHRELFEIIFDMSTRFRYLARRYLAALKFSGMNIDLEGIQVFIEINDLFLTRSQKLIYFFEL